MQTIVKGGATTKVTAKANTGYQFAGWSDGVKTPERTDSGVQESKTLTAKFEKIQTSVPTPTPNPEAPQASGVKLNEKKVVMGVGEKVTLKAAVLSAGASQKVTWTSGKKSVVTVSADGRLKGRKPGSTMVTAKTANGKTVKCKVIVRKAPKKLTVKTVNKVLKKGKSFRIKVKFPKKTASYRLTYTSSKKKVAVVSSTGEAGSPK